MTNDEWYVIKDFESFINSTRAIVYNSLGNDQEDTENDTDLTIVLEKEKEELDKVLSYDESVIIAQGILKKQINKKTKTERYLVSDSKYIELLSSLNHRLVGNILHSLVNKGLVESGFDDEANDFIFWVKNNDQTDRN